VLKRLFNVPRAGARISRASGHSLSVDPPASDLSGTIAEELPHDLLRLELQISILAHKKCGGPGTIRYSS